jgi:hypothetical protein
MVLLKIGEPPETMLSLQFSPHFLPEGMEFQGVSATFAAKIIKSQKEGTRNKKQATRVYYFELNLDLGPWQLETFPYGRTIKRST